VRRLTTVDVMLLSTVLIWSFNITVTRYVLTHGFRPLAYASIRYGAAALLCLVLTVALDGSPSIGGRRSLALLAGAALMLCLNQFAFVYALKLATGTTVALLLGTMPIFTALVSFAVGLERPTARLWTAALITFGGVALVAIGSGGDLSAHLGGDLLALSLALTWSVYSVVIAPLMRRYSPYRISALMLVAVSVPLAAAGSPQLAHQDYGGLGRLVWIALVFATVGPLVVTNILWFKAIDRVGPSRATLVANLQPFVAAIFAYLILSEHIKTIQIAGGVAILAGILFGRAPRPAAIPVE
jgi:drug/metabolite transporter (DMT)-like permease